MPDQCKICGAPLRLVVTFEGVSVPSGLLQGVQYTARWQAASEAERQKLREEMVGLPREVFESGRAVEGRCEVTCSVAGRPHGTYLVGAWRPEGYAAS